ncbi:MAG: radical SAM protein [Nitrospinae bacterium]|nr:radical SAM protein [Nitrospinota bacterium]
MKLKRRIKLALAKQFLGYCSHLSFALSIRSNKMIEPCACMSTNVKSELLPFEKNSFITVLNAPLYKNSRNFINGRNHNEPVFSICKSCRLKEHTRYPFITLKSFTVALSGISFSGKLKKIKNLIQILFEAFMKKEAITAAPIYANIDPVNACNLECPFCVVGAGDDIFEKELLKIEDFKEIMQEIGPYLFHLSLYRYGEPFLHPKIFEMIAEAKKYGIYVHISTNLLLLDEIKIKKLVEAKPDQIIACADGVNQETYQKYRRKGDYALFIKNLTLLSQEINKQRANIELKWQFLVFGYNEHQIKEAEEIATKIGAAFSAEAAYINGDDEEYKEFIPSKKAYTLNDE